MKKLHFTGRNINARGIFRQYTLDWPENPTNADKLKVYEQFEHIINPELQTWHNGQCVKVEKYAQFYGL